MHQGGHVTHPGESIPMGVLTPRPLAEKTPHTGQSRCWFNKIKNGSAEIGRAHV